MPHSPSSPTASPLPWGWMGAGDLEGKGPMSHSPRPAPPQPGSVPVAWPCLFLHGTPCRYVRDLPRVVQVLDECSWENSFLLSSVLPNFVWCLRDVAPDPCLDEVLKATGHELDSALSSPQGAWPSGPFPQGRGTLASGPVPSLA